MHAMKIVIGPDQDAFKVYSAADGSDITDHLLVKDLTVFASPDGVDVTMTLHAEVEVETEAVELRSSAP